LFHKTAGHYVRSGDKHLLRACDFNRTLERGEVQKAAREYSKALDTFLEDERKHQERFEKYVLKGGGRFPEKRDERAPHISLKLGQWPYKSCLSFSAIRPLNEGMIFARKVLAYFLDGQYDQVNYVVEEAGYHLASYGAEVDLLWARVLAAKGIYEDSLILSNASCSVFSLLILATCLLLIPSLAAISILVGPFGSGEGELSGISSCFSSLSSSFTALAT